MLPSLVAVIDEPVAPRSEVERDADGGAGELEAACLFLDCSYPPNDNGPPKRPVGIGGDEEDRTPDLRIANATLSQLSYVPINGIL
jgi:hypothetical protein